MFVCEKPSRWHCRVYGFCSFVDRGFLFFERSWFYGCGLVVQLSLIHILGQFGENTSCEIMYYIYTSKSDASKAKFLIDEQIKKYAKDEYQ